MDSVVIIEKATAPAIRKTVLVMRLSMERPEVADAGFVKVIGTNRKKTFAALQEVLKEESDLPYVSLFSDGTAAQKTVEIIKKSWA
jgi:UDP-N-acetylglucosamine 2-epimerase